MSACRRRSAISWWRTAFSATRAWSTPSATSASAIRRMPDAISWRARGAPASSPRTTSSSSISTATGSTAPRADLRRALHPRLPVQGAAGRDVGVSQPCARGGAVHRDQHADRADLGDGVGQRPDIPNWDIRDEFPNEGTMLVVNDATGRSLAKTLGAGRVCLLRGHGAVIATSELKATVMVSIGLMCNAAMLIQAHTLSQGRGDAAVKHLSPAEIESTSKILLGPLGLDRAWEYWRVRAGFPPKEA